MIDQFNPRITVKEVASLCGVYVPTIWRWLRADPHFKRLTRWLELPVGCFQRRNTTSIALQKINVIKAAI